jgi:hypothetical protein
MYFALKKHTHSDWARPLSWARGVHFFFPFHKGLCGPLCLKIKFKKKKKKKNTHQGGSIIEGI